MPIFPGSIVIINTTRWCTYVDWISTGGTDSGTFVHPSCIALVIHLDYGDFVEIVTPCCTRPLLIESRFLIPIEDT